MSLASRTMSVEEFLALPENDGVDRELIYGELRERPMTIRNRFHTKTLILVGSALHNWLSAQPEPRGEVHGGDVGFRLPTDPPTVVGIDIAYINYQQASNPPQDSSIFHTVPILAVEILSPSDTIEQVTEKIELYLSVDVQQVWIIEPKLKTVRIYRPDGSSTMLDINQRLLGDPELPGFNVPVARFFDGLSN